MEQKLAEFITAKSAVESMLYENSVVVRRVEVVNKLAFLPTKQDEANVLAQLGTLLIAGGLVVRIKITLTAH